MEIQDKERKILKEKEIVRPFDFDRIWLGSIPGILAPVITMFVFYQVNFSHLSLNKFVEHLFAVHIQSSLLSLCVVSNLLVFFIFIWSEKYNSARGVLLSTFLYGALVVYLKFFI
jgi:hypothetical protein